MTPNPSSVTEAELSVLQVLWAMGLATIREIRDELYPGGATSEYSTVQKLLERLEAKSLVRRSREQVPHTFAARVDRDALIGQRLSEVADALCDGSMAGIVSHLVQRRDLSAAEREQLRLLFERVAAPGKRRRSKR